MTETVPKTVRGTMTLPPEYFLTISFIWALTAMLTLGQTQLIHIFTDLFIKPYYLFS